jgi:hypothetical protein
MRTQAEAQAKKLEQYLVGSRELGGVNSSKPLMG